MMPMSLPNMHAGSCVHSLCVVAVVCLAVHCVMKALLLRCREIQCWPVQSSSASAGQPQVGLTATLQMFLLYVEARVAAWQAAREIAGTIANSNNRVFLNSDSLLLNLVRTLHCLAVTSAWKLVS